MMIQLLKVLLLMFLLTVLGEPIRFFILKRFRIFAKLDFTQSLIIDIYIGGMLLYLLAIPPLPFLHFFTILSFTTLCFFISLLVHGRSLYTYRRSESIKTLVSGKKAVLMDNLLVFNMFFFLLFFNFISLSGLVLGPIFDESIHALKVEVILENGYIPLTLQPYLQEGIVYPAAAHVIFAYATQMLALPVPESVFFVTLLFKALTVFGAYFLGKNLSPGRTCAISLSFAFTFISSWPLYVVWGSNPFLVGFPLFLVNLGLLFSIINFEKSSFPELVVAGLLFGYNGSLIVSYVQTLMFMACIVCVYLLIWKKNFGLIKLYEFLVLLFSSLLTLSPFLYRFFAFYQYPGHNIGLPADFLGYQVTRLQLHATQALSWAFENISPHYPLRLLTFIIMGLLAFLLWKKKDATSLRATVFALLVLLSATMLSFISFFLPSDLEVISWGHQGIIMATSLSIMIAMLYTNLKKLCYNLKPKRDAIIFPKKIFNLLLIVLILAALNTPFIYYRVLRDPTVMYDTYRMYAVTTEDDYQLMVWIKENVPRDAIILISPYESGLLIPTISYNKIVFPYTATAFCRSYQNLKELLLNCVLNQTTYYLIQNFNASYVFVASDAAFWWFEKRKLDPFLFLGNPNFKLVKNFGNAYLFKFNYSFPYVIFYDDFKHEFWNELGWQVYSYGNGAGNSKIINGSNSKSEVLELSSEAFYAVGEVRYAYCITRKFFVPDGSDVSLSFYLNATNGFNGKDTFAFVISNIYRNQSIVITTPNGVYENYAYSKSLTGREGFFKFSLSALWHQFYNSTLPNVFILDMVNYDTDGIKNIAYVDGIQINLYDG